MVQLHSIGLNQTIPVQRANHQNQTDGVLGGYTTKEGIQINPGSVSTILLVLDELKTISEGTATTGALEGIILEAAGKTIPGAIVTVMDPETGLVRTTKSDGQGRFAISLLPPGFYTITVSAPGYETARETNFPVDITQTKIIDPPIRLNRITQPRRTPTRPRRPD